MPSEVERVALNFPNVSQVKVYGNNNPITGQHVELTVQPLDPLNFDKKAFKYHLKHSLQSHMLPKKIVIGSVAVGHRFKRS